MKMTDLKIITGSLGPIIKQYVTQEIAKAIGPLQTRLLELVAADEIKAQRIKCLEERPIGMIFKGAWDPATTYAPGEGVQWDGHMWSAKTSTFGQTPGSSDSWVLVTRRGKDGRPGRDARDLRIAS